MRSYRDTGAKIRESLEANEIWEKVEVEVMGLRVPPPPNATPEQVRKWVEEGRRDRLYGIVGGFVIGAIIVLAEVFYG